MRPPLSPACSFSPSAASKPVASDEPAPARLVFDVRDFGATGIKEDLAQEAIQKAVDACAAGGGGTVLFPPGDYTSGTIHLRSRVRLYLEGGATDPLPPRQIPLRQGRPPLRRGPRRRHHRGARHLRRRRRLRPAAQGRPRRRLHPAEPGRDGEARPAARCGPSPSPTGPARWSSSSAARTSGSPASPSSIRPPGRSTPSNANGWSSTASPSAPASRTASGPTASIPTAAGTSGSPTATIETGDDALVFYSMDWFGPARPCENITVTNCRLSSASSAIKFCDGNIAGIRNVTVDNCVITASNRGIAFMTFDGGARRERRPVQPDHRHGPLRVVLVGRRRAVPLQHQEEERGPRQLARGKGPAGRGHPQRQDPERHRPRPRFERLQRPSGFVARGRVLRERQAHRRPRSAGALRQGRPRDPLQAGPRPEAARRRGRLGGAGLGEMGERSSPSTRSQISSSTASPPCRRRATSRLRRCS
ncbi:MAG: hypothetical protein M0C28_27305 [Candidatus Moduliflexus flocculans]|nr:hypothetical protein [Candidatus Moduliflexus flocculans]